MHRSGTIPSISRTIPSQPGTISSRSSTVPSRSGAIPSQSGTVPGWKKHPPHAKTLRYNSLVPTANWHPTPHDHYNWMPVATSVSSVTNCMIATVNFAVNEVDKTAGHRFQHEYIKRRFSPRSIDTATTTVRIPRALNHRDHYRRIDSASSW